MNDPRFEITPSVDIVREAVAPRMDVFWNPETGAGSVSFWVEHQEFENGVFKRRFADNRMQMRPLAVPLDDVVMREHTITFPDGTEMVCPPGTLALLVKKVFPVHYAERLIAMTQEFVPAPPPQPDENGNIETPPLPPLGDGAA